LFQKDFLLAESDRISYYKAKPVVQPKIVFPKDPLIFNIYGVSS